MATPSVNPPPHIQPCRYKTGKTLGAGSYSVVKECVHIDTNRYYAAKVINKRLMAGREHMVRNEIAVLKRVSMGHRHILTLVDYFETNNNLYLVTDLALGGELFDRICRKGSYYESDAAELIRSTLSAVAYLHDHGIVHRDLKPENLLFRTADDSSDLLIADFGLSRIIDEEQFHLLTTTCGTPGYMAPEIFRKSGHGKPVDMWAIGVITYFLLCGYTPFDRESNLEEMQAILSADYSFTPEPYWRNISPEACDFIRRCLTVEQESRITAHEGLSHLWITTDQPWTPGRQDLLPTVKKNFNARGKLHVAIDTIRAINQLRSAGLRQANAQKAKDEADARAAGAASAAAAVAAAGGPSNQFQRNVGLNIHQTAAATATSSGAYPSSPFVAVRPPPLPPAPTSESAPPTSSGDNSSSSPVPVYSPSPMTPLVHPFHQDGSTSSPQQPYMNTISSALFSPGGTITQGGPTPVSSGQPLGELQQQPPQQPQQPQRQQPKPPSGLWTRR